MFADDIIIFLTNPETALAATHKILTSFSGISYYKVNFTQSLILDLGIDTTLCNKLQNLYPYTWSTDGIPYLGIRLISDLSRIAEVNYLPLIDKLTKDKQCNPDAIQM